MLINEKEKGQKRKIRVGDSLVEQTQSAKLLGIVMDEDQKWNSHFCGKNGLMTALNKRLYTIKRLANHIPRDKLKKVADSLWTSKLRYGLQLCLKVRLREEEIDRLEITT